MEIDLAFVERIADEVSTVVSSHLEYSQEDKKQMSVAEINKRVKDERYILLIFNTLWGAGFLQEYLNDTNVENVLINKFDEIYVEYSNEKRIKLQQRFFSSEEELRIFINKLAHRSGSNERLSVAQPALSVVLPDGSRMQAIMGISPNICVAIRRHGTKEMRLSDLYKSGMFSQQMLRFLKSLIAAGVNVIIAGIQGAGKTTLLRAMGLEIPESERIATLETDYELYLHHFHNQVIALTEQRSSTANTIKLKDLIPIVLRMNVIRLIVGEVRSQEIIPMIEAMTAGASGSMCTIHAMNPDAVLGRLIELIQTSVASATIESAKRRISNAINFTIYVKYEDYTHVGGSKKRFISNIVEYVPSGTDITTANIFEDGEFKTRPSKYILERLLRIDKDIMEIFGKYH